MSSFVGGFTVNIDKVSELMAMEEANTKWYKAKSYDRMYYATFGPFVVGDYKCEVRVSPKEGTLDFYICFPENAAALNKCGSITLLLDPNYSTWTAKFFSTEPYLAKSFKMDRGFIKASGLPTVYAALIFNYDVLKYSKDDCLVAKFVVWVPLDDSKIAPAKPAQQPDKKPNQSNYTPQVSIGTLLTRKFADVQFIVKEQTFSAHRAIIASQSSVFESELLALEDEMCWKKLHIYVQHMDAITFKYMLHFIYTGSLPSDFENTPRRYRLLFIAAHRFKIEGLKLICEEELTKAVTENLITILELNECEQELSLLKIVPKDLCHINSEIVTTTTSGRKAPLGDRVYDE